MAKVDDKVAALADTSKLDKFDGKDVVRTSIAVTNAGDGLSTALAVDPRQLHHDEEVVIVLRGNVSKIGFVPLSAETPDLLNRLHTIKAGTATILDATAAQAVQQYLNDQDERIKLAKEKAEGIERLPLEAQSDGAHAGQPDDPDDPLLGDDEADEVDATDPDRIGGTEGRRLSLEKRDDGWFIVDKATGEAIHAEPYSSRNAARIAKSAEEA